MKGSRETGVSWRKCGVKGNTGAHLKVFNQGGDPISVLERLIILIFCCRVEIIERDPDDRQIQSQLR